MLFVPSVYPKKNQILQELYRVWIGKMIGCRKSWWRVDLERKTRSGQCGLVWARVAMMQGDGLAVGRWEKRALVVRVGSNEHEDCNQAISSGEVAFLTFCYRKQNQNVITGDICFFMRKRADPYSPF